MLRRILENYMTGLEFSFTDDSGEHPKAIAIASMLLINPVGETNSDEDTRHITLQMQVYHSREVFEKGGKPLVTNNLQKQFLADEYVNELNNSPLTMLIIARHLRKKIREIEIETADGTINLKNAKAIAIPPELDTPELDAFLDQYDQIEIAMRQQIISLAEENK